MRGNLDDQDRKYLQLAVKISRSYREDQSRWPFGALLVIDGKIAGQGVNQVVELHDPTAHAEVMALRAPAAATGRHQFENSALYYSSEPCLMCPAACYWALVPRIVFGATINDTADYGVREDALTAVRDWATHYRRY
jgi:guanine deaminase